MITTERLRPHRFLTLRLFLSNLCGLLLAVLLLNNTANSATVDPRLLFLGDFETGAIQSEASNPDGWDAQCCYDYNFEVVTSPVRAGNYAVKIYLKANDDYARFGRDAQAGTIIPRAQLMKDSPGYMNLDPRVGRWFAYSIYYPSDWPITSYMSVMSEYGNIYHKVQNSDDTEIIHNRWGTGPGLDPDGTEDVYVNTLTRGVWTDWVFYYYPSWESDGVLKIWKNGVLIVNKKGANCIQGYMGWTNVRIKLYGNDHQKFTVYFDEFRMARGPDTQEYYDLVAPPPRSQVPVPTKVEVSPGK